MPTFIWTDEKVSLLRELFNDQILSAEKIGYQLNCCRHTVLRKAKDLGLDFQIRNLNKRKSLKASRNIKFLEPQLELDTGWYIPMYQRKTLFDLKDHHCRYPFNDVGSPDFFFCGADVKEGKSYCVKHCMTVYKPYEKRSFKEPNSKSFFSFKRS